MNDVKKVVYFQNVRMSPLYKNSRTLDQPSDYSPNSVIVVVAKVF